MNANRTTSYSGDVGTDTPPESICAAAYDEMRRALDYSAELIEQLENKLSPVLCEKLTSIGQKGDSKAEPVHSQVHGWLAYGTNSAASLNVRLHDLLGRVTV